MKPNLSMLRLTTRITPVSSSMTVPYGASWTCVLSPNPADPSAAGHLHLSMQHSEIVSYFQVRFASILGILASRIVCRLGITSLHSENEDNDIKTQRALTTCIQKRTRRQKAGSAAASAIAPKICGER